MVSLGILEPHADTRRMMVTLMKASGYSAFSAADGGRFLDSVAKDRPQMVLMEMDLKKLSGWDVLRSLRAIDSGRRLLIMAVSYGWAAMDVVRVLDAGADDHMPKPFDCDVMLARMAALLRRDAWHGGESLTELPIRLGELLVDNTRHVVEVEGIPVSLRPLEFSLLSYLCRHIDRILPRSLLLEQVWNENGEQDTRTVDQTMQTLRRKIDGALRIESVYGIGYRVNPRDKKPPKRQR